MIGNLVSAAICFACFSSAVYTTQESMDFDGVLAEVFSSPMRYVIEVVIRPGLSTCTRFNIINLQLR
jgi:hypothetical protein